MSVCVLEACCRHLALLSLSTYRTDHLNQKLSEEACSIFDVFTSESLKLRRRKIKHVIEDLKTSRRKTDFRRSVQLVIKGIVQPIDKKFLYIFK